MSTTKFRTSLWEFSNALMVYQLTSFLPRTQALWFVYVIKLIHAAHSKGRASHRTTHSAWVRGWLPSEIYERYSPQINTGWHQNSSDGLWRGFGNHRNPIKKGRGYEFATDCPSCSHCPSWSEIKNFDLSNKSSSSISQSVWVKLGQCKKYQNFEFY